MYFFTSPTSNILSQPRPAIPTSVPMTRSGSNTSATSTTSTATGSMSISMTSSPSWTIRPTSSSSCTSTATTCPWLTPPFRSCLHAADEASASSYLSDDDLLCLAHSDADEHHSSSQAPERELTTEEQIALLRAQQDRDEQALASGYARPEAWWRDERLYAQQQLEKERERKARMVRFAGEAGPTHRRPSGGLKRRSPAIRRGLSGLSS